MNVKNVKQLQKILNIGCKILKVRMCCLSLSFMTVIEQSLVFGLLTGKKQ